jgi:23S rRNA pseudouridine2605 synthase
LTTSWILSVSRAGRAGGAPRRRGPGRGDGGPQGNARKTGGAAGSGPGGAGLRGRDGRAAGWRDAASGPAEPGPAELEPSELEDDLDDWGDEDDEGQRDSLTDVPGGIRLQKVLAAAGIGSRRHCEELIAAGRVEVDGEIVRRFGARVDPQHQVIRVDGRRIPASEDLVYVALNKPAGVLTTMSDSRGRATMADLLGDIAERLYHVGRLDYDTEGLMLLMNDGELAHRLAHPRYGVPKTYLAEVTGTVPRDLARQLIGGIELDDGVASADKFRVVERLGGRALVEITLHEGRKHIVRRMLAAAGHPVTRLVRTHVGPIALGSLRPGTTRHLSVKEVGDLYAAVGL